MPASETIPQDVRSADPLFAGPPQKAEWMSDLPKSDWLFDGYPIRGEVMLSRFEALDWSKAWVDMGPSIAGNLGPYWHVPLVGDDETVHRLYPKLLQSKWLPLVRQAVSEAVARATAAERERSEAAEARCDKLAEALRPLGSLLVYTFEDDPGTLHVSYAGETIATVDLDTPAGTALLKLEQEVAAVCEALEQVGKR